MDSRYRYTRNKLSRSLPINQLPPSPSSPTFPLRWLRDLVMLAGLCLAFFNLVIFLSGRSWFGDGEKTLTPVIPISPMTSQPLNDSLVAFADTVLLVMKTGGSVIYNRLPVHLFNELGSINLIQNHLYVSDIETTLAGRVIHDVLLNVSDPIKQQSEYQPYLKQRLALYNGEPIDSIGNTWQLDKYKFLPMKGLSYRTKPDASFYIYIEEDTYLIQEGLLRYLQTFNSSEMLFFGHPAMINGRWFAHGGTGYVFSQGLMNATWGLNPYLEHQFDQHAGHECCGDLIISDVLRNLSLGIDGPNINPDHRFQGEPPHLMRIEPNNWCSPVFTFHHVDAQHVQRLFNFEREVRAQQRPDDYLRYRDVFDYFRPHFMRSGAATVYRINWDNSAEGRYESLEDAGPLGDCQSVCEKKCAAWDQCLQWTSQTTVSLQPHLNRKCECRLGQHLRFGRSSHIKIASGWRMDRVNTMAREANC